MTVLQFIHDGVLSIVGACAPVISVALLRLMHLQGNQIANTTITAAINRSAGVAIDYALSVNDPLLVKAENKSVALAKALNYTITAAGPQLDKMAVDQQLLAKKVASQLALQLHVSTVAANVVHNPDLPVYTKDKPQ